MRPQGLHIDTVSASEYDPRVSIARDSAIRAAPWRSFFDIWNGMLRLFHQITRFWPQICTAGAALGAVGVLWRVRDAPLELGANMRVDALSAFFSLVTLGGLALALALAPAPRPWLARYVIAAVVLVLVYNATLTLAIAAGYLLVALVVRGPQPTVASRWAGFSRAALATLARRAVTAAPWLLAALCLLIGYGTLLLRGALHYTDVAAGAGLDSFVFWFVLLAATIPVAPLRAPEDNPRSRQMPAGLAGWALAIAWSYPLLRLYSLGPWNTGWSLATLLVAGALACWCATSAFTERDHRRRDTRLNASYFAMALAAIGLGTSAGIAAACFCLLAVLILGAGIAGEPARSPIGSIGGPSDQQSIDSSDRSTSSSLIAWLLAGVFPFTTPFVATWMLIGASVAAGVPLLAGIAWLVALVNGLTIALWGGANPPRRIALALASSSVALGVGAPLVVRGVIQPVVAQLQGGLTPYGDIAIWPWVGLAANDAAHVQITTLPSIAIALLMLVLTALVYVVVRLRDTYADTPPATPNGSASTTIDATSIREELLRNLRDDVPWLGVLIGPRAQPEESPRECE